MEGHAMVGSGTILTDGIAMDGGGITLVLIPMVLGIFLMNLEHIVVAIGFGKNAGGGNAHIGGIALDNGGVGNVLIGHEPIAVDEEVLGADFQLSHGTMHGKNGGTENVNFVDFIGRNDTYSPRQGFALNDLSEGVALTLGKLFGIVKGRKTLSPALPHNGEGATTKRQDDSSSIYRTGKAAATSFVATCFYQVFM